MFIYIYIIGLGKFIRVSLIYCDCRDVFIINLYITHKTSMCYLSMGAAYSKPDIYEFVAIES